MSSSSPPPSSSPSSPPSPPIAQYEHMFREVEGIIKQLSHPHLSLDDMIQQVKHGYDLIRSMRGRLQEATFQIEELQRVWEHDQKAAKSLEEDS